MHTAAAIPKDHIAKRRRAEQGKQGSHGLKEMSRHPISNEKVSINAMWGGFAFGVRWRLECRNMNVHQGSGNASQSAAGEGAYFLLPPPQGESDGQAHCARPLRLNQILSHHRLRLKGRAKVTHGVYGGSFFSGYGI
jgi:hypothetical protein